MSKELRENVASASDSEELPSTNLQSKPVTVTPKSVQLEREVRALILDYALGVSILGLIPIRGILTLKLLIAAGFLLKMMREVGAKWSFLKGQDILAVFGNLFGGFGAFAMAFMAWVTMFSIGLFVPYIGSLAVAASLFTLTWGLGQATSQFYASGRRN